MKLSSYRSGPTPPSHVDQGIDVVSTDHPVHDIVRALSDGAVPIHEARIAMAMTINGELKGFRHIEQASGITDDAILRVIPEAGASTTLLSCTNRGKFAYEEEERRPIDLHLRPYRPSSGHYRSLSSNPLNDQGIKGSNDLEDIEVLEEKPNGVRQVTRGVLGLLDPSLDVWKNATEGCAERQEFGDAGWALAVVTGLKPTTFTLDEISRITRVGERQARRIIDKLTKWGWAKRVREGRYVRVVVDFSLMDHEDHRQDYLKFTRRARKAAVAQYEQFVVKRLGTRTGREVRDMWKNRVREIRMLKEWAQYTGSRCWDRMISVLSNTEMGRWWAERELIKMMESGSTSAIL